MNSIIFRRITTQLSANYFRYNTQNYKLISCKTYRKLYSFPNGLNETKCLTERQSMNRWISTSTRIELLVNRLNDSFVQQKRFKKGKKSQKRDAKEESSDEESDEEVEQFDEDLIDGKAVDFKDRDVAVVSLRMDTILKSGINIIRSRVDEAIYDNRVRINGERVTKKSAEVFERDEIDLIKGLNQENPDLLDIYRVVIKKVEDKSTSKDRIRAKLRIFRSLTIENYPNSPYDGLTINIVKKELDEN